jgi:eukaryotic-like serine/threonine-protein kinase
VTSGAAGGSLAGSRAGPWKLTEPIAEGGMGAVYRARRDDGAFEQQAAIKLIRPELLRAPC